MAPVAEVLCVITARWEGSDLLSANQRWISDQPIAHRGLHDAENPENSIGAFNQAVAAGYGIELDIHCSRDGRLVVFHDDNAKRLTGRDLKVTSASFAELSALRLAATAYRISALEEVLELVDGRVPVMIEVKTGSKVGRVGPLLAAVLAKYSGPVAVQSFDPRIVMWLRKNVPGVARGQLSGSMSDPGLPGLQRMVLRTMLLNAASRPDFIAFEVGAMPDRFVSFWQRVLRGPLLLWTVRTDAELSLARQHGANVIFENIRPTV
jgi:glycerophosphoryl diester phosphodiesterase